MEFHTAVPSCRLRFTCERRRIARVFVVVLGFVSLFLPQAVCRAQTPRWPRPLAETAKKASVIVVAKITSVPRVPKEPAENAPPKTPSLRKAGADYTLMDDFPGARSPGPPAQFQAETITYIKGQISGKFAANVPRGAFAPPFGERELKSGDTVLFFLRRTGSKKNAAWNVVDSAVPAVRLTGDGGKRADALDSARAVPRVMPRLVSLLLPSLADRELRPLCAYYLASVRDARLVPALLPYVNDSNLQTRDTVLTGLATNQCVDAIAPIITLARTCARQKKAAPVSLAAIGKIRSPKAVAALNHLLFEKAVTTRRNAVMALSPVASQSSAPFLMVALQDKDISYDAYLILHRLARVGGEPKDPAYFYRHKDAATEPIVRWYAKQTQAATGKKQ